MNMAVSSDNLVYRTLAQELLQLDPTEDYTPNAINLRRILPYGEGTN